MAAPRDRAATAASLARVERALRDPTTPPSEIDRLGEEQQLAYRALVAHPDWLDGVLRRVPAALRPIVTANAHAGRELRALGREGALPEQLPDWRIVPPLPVEVLRAYYGEAEAATGIPWAYLAAVHLVETRLGRIEGTSSAGAQGPMQFIPATWARYGQGDINDNRDAILAAARFLQANGGPADMGRA
ncbi:MAG TPA: lytic transglycosylase domain-containing protein, partial [Acidimicrobiia bacterium]|nr:lytic transglycosylase domain-containing protein [Acidimicrobiia bacterium]